MPHWLSCAPGHLRRSRRVRLCYPSAMCRSIKTLRGTEFTDEEIAAAALQFVRKVSGYRKPSQANEEVFDGRGSMRSPRHRAGCSTRWRQAAKHARGARTPPGGMRPLSRS